MMNQKFVFFCSYDINGVSLLQPLVRNRNSSDDEDFPVTRHRAFIMSMEPPKTTYSRCNTNTATNGTT